MMETNILLESGTNEFELLEFTIGSNHYGINVAKISELIQYIEPTPLPNANPCIEGIIMPRDMIISVIDLPQVLNISEPNQAEKDMYIITNFNQLYTAFHVHNVLGIHRVYWSDISKPSATVSGAEDGVATGIVKLNDKLVVILDFEKIVTEINPETGLKMSDIEKLGDRDRNEHPIVIAEDSPLLERMIVDCLTQAGYTNVIPTTNGQEAWDLLMQYKEHGTLQESVSCVITDIEMPRMDGHRLTKLIKTDNEMEHIPVVIFSSLVNDQMRAKGKALGADAQLSKPEIGSLVQEIDTLIGAKAK